MSVNDLYDTSELSSVLIEAITNVIECKGYKRIQFYERKLFLANIVSIFISIFFLIDVNKRNEPINRWLYLLGGAYSVVWLIAGGLNLLLNSNQSVEIKKIEDGFVQKISLGLRHILRGKGFSLVAKKSIENLNKKSPSYKKKASDTERVVSGSFNKYFYDDGSVHEKNIAELVESLDVDKFFAGMRETELKSL